MRILVIGAGDIGFHLSRRLSQDGHDVTVAEVDAERLRRVADQLDVLTVQGDAATWAVLQRAGVAGMDAVAAVTTHEEANLLACRLAKKAGAAHTLARVRNPELTRPDYPLSPEELGVDAVVHPEREAGAAVVRLIRQSGATDLVELADGRIRLLGVRLEAGSPLLRKPLAELDRERGHPPVRVTAIKRKQQTVIPTGQDVLVEGDQIYVLCDPDYLDTFIERTGQKDARVRDLMMVGGGLIGQFVATELAAEVHTKLIERDAERAVHIADLLPEALVIEGDGTDSDLLTSEGIADMDAFVAVTGDDESNIIASLLARRLGAPRTVALVNTVEYLPIMPTIGLDAVVSKELLTVNAVLRFLHQRSVANIATIPGLDAHCIEFIAGAGSLITRKPLRDVEFPRNARVGAVLHGDRLEVPTGDTRVGPGDKVIVFALPSARHAVEEMIS